MHKIMHFKTSHHPRTWSLSICNAAIVMALGFIGSLSPTATYAQSTTVAIFGKAPAGETLTATSDTGLHRHGTANKMGRYRIGPLSTGNYTVTLEKDGHIVDKRTNIALFVGRSAEVDFACPNDNCAASD